MLDAAGFPWVLVETVGVGQVEVEIAGAADTTVVVVNPGWGDAVQANKAGLMEIADVFVINKADRPGAADTRRDLEAMLDLTASLDDAGWRPPIVETVATDGTGVDELWAADRRAPRRLTASGELAARRGRQARAELERIVAERLAAAGPPARPRATASRRWPTRSIADHRPVGRRRRAAGPRRLTPAAPCPIAPQPHRNHNCPVRARIGSHECPVRDPKCWLGR